MAEDKHFGHCMHCRFYQQHHGAGVAGTGATEEVHCMQPQLEAFGLVVTDSSGCDLFEARANLAPSIEEPAHTVH